jgi:nucleoside 2-deoxyribosyltransferase
VRADKLPGAMERITSKIISHLLEANMIVADLTDGNPNVFWELGYLNSLGKPVVQMIQKGQKLPFNVFDIPTIPYSIEVGKYKASRKELIEKIREVEKEKKKTAAPRKRQTKTRYWQKKKAKKKVGKKEKP